MSGAAVPEGARVVLATRNQGKVRELRALLAAALPELDVETAVVDAGAVDAPDVVEDGVTFEENALKKARQVAAHTGLVAVADDSGLAVDVLGGAPGIFSARWAGRHGDDAANLRLLLDQLADVPDEHRGATFVCAAALAVPGGPEHVELGRLEGTLLREPVGEGGFGYDPILRPAGQTRSTAQLSPEEKNAISHRGQAFDALLPHLVAALTPAS
ncbi:RdgB/HAM1 family non-canonical purine NTP pyrophosphatase [Micrococcus sp.]|uniref:RdgB/HAM1 family non-canonical purine NTP pyrophosphatase n=1 Tax=Micrococcus sp. TaxID=1271 RepID=UPI002A908D28|nr:RdgB/HAM1 family non-canonical purine NTP pyrophosphatase [Micrococcus sp.]MDY6055700.1 RdgB/HAM1 family non-canonical purine NTP pyrophosphatase [Micrococcus sp.]